MDGVRDGRGQAGTDDKIKRREGTYDRSTKI
jgi:hypothetical protein